MAKFINLSVFVVCYNYAPTFYAICSKIFVGVAVTLSTIDTCHVLGLPGSRTVCAAGFGGDRVWCMVSVSVRIHVNAIKHVNKKDFENLLLT